MADWKLAKGWVPSRVEPSQAKAKSSYHTWLPGRGLFPGEMKLVFLVKVRSCLMELMLVWKRSAVQLLHLAIRTERCDSATLTLLSHRGAR